MHLEGYFGSMKTARDTAEELKQKGYKAFIDSNDEKNADRDFQTNSAGTETAISLSNLVLNGTNANEDTMDKSPLLAASPMVSGVGTFDEIANVKHKLTVEAEENSKSKIVQIIHKAGGTLYNPNVVKPDRISDNT